MNETLIKQVEALNGDNRLTFLCNAVALLHEKVNNINWVGLYILKGNTLHLGPFQGKVACEKIELGRGVCGKALANNEVLNVKNVKEFIDHIACDPDTKSELCIPLVYNNKKLGVLDFDSKVVNRFNEYDTKILIEVAKIITNGLARPRD